MKALLKKYLLYLTRWQLSAPILAACVVWFATLGTSMATVLASLIGGLIFFWVDKSIFQKANILKGEVCEVQQDIAYADCGHLADRRYGLAQASDYDKMNNNRPESRCHDCSGRKYWRQFVGKWIVSPVSLRDLAGLYGSITKVYRSTQMLGVK